MPPNYRYSFFDSFHASPALALHAESAPLSANDAIEVIPKTVANSSMLAMPVVYHTMVQSAPIEIGGLGGLGGFGGLRAERVEDFKVKHAPDLEKPKACEVFFIPVSTISQVLQWWNRSAKESKAEADIASRWDKPRKGTLEIKGQGTVSVKTDSTIGFHIVVQTEDPKLPNLYLDVTRDSCVFSYGGLPSIDGGTLSSASRQPIPDECLAYPKGNSSAWLREDQGPYNHWLSIDLENGILRYGRGYCTASLVLLQAVFKTKRNASWFTLIRNGNGFLTEMVIDPFPLVRDLSPYVVKDRDITLDDLESGIVTVVANLPEASGPKIALDTPDFPDFSQAIERSVRTEGLLGHNLLLKKDTEFGESNFGALICVSRLEQIWILMNDIMIIGNSPGIPYVLEIWPSGHSSPIHDHGDSFAVIKVLHGKIHAYYFDGLEKPGPNQQGSPALLMKDDVTWISNNNYQVHQLKNESDQLCCTIQCYQYGPSDKIHYEGFRYIANGKPKLPDDEPFFPDSDMAFGEFKKAIKKEWYAYQLEKMK
ncbi:hypothetical protein BDZ97DRAFT_1760419 [Flammula alnicola]|nr:hypothetical protein BDZ97DRAFT_1760419 [Flammula alnicola]